MFDQRGVLFLFLPLPFPVFTSFAAALESFELSERKLHQENRSDVTRVAQVCCKVINPTKVIGDVVKVTQTDTKGNDI